MSVGIGSGAGINLGTLLQVAAALDTASSEDTIASAPLDEVVGATSAAEDAEEAVALLNDEAPAETENVDFAAEEADSDSEAADSMSYSHSGPDDKIVSDTGDIIVPSSNGHPDGEFIETISRKGRG